MYKCDKCGKTSEPKEKCNIVPCEIRTKCYPMSSSQARPEGTIGTEIVKERKLCNGCFKG
jgi:hypothetical protein